MGVQVSIDDFGTGYSSLARLKKFPIDGVKIDRSFIRDIVTSPDDAAITTAIIAMAHSLRLRVVAEGVESRAQVRFLRERGCDEIQGFYYSRPVPASKILAIAQRHSAPRLRAVERSA
jgi:EAL domain-containing protein (putative c-di-GMP-specific phosphodiesterase class I)